MFDMVKKVQSFNIGTFIAGNRFERDFVGVVTSIRDEYTVNFYNFLEQTSHTNSFRNFFSSNEKRKDNLIEKVTKQKALKLIQEKWDQFEDRIRTGGLEGALVSREQYSLGQVISCIKEVKDSSIIEKKVIEVPRTGVYVLEGKYGRRRDGDRRFLDGLVMKPRQDEELIKEFIELLYKGGTENIPSTCGMGDLEGYEVTEIPKKGIKLVKPKLVIDISEKRVS
jgi:hypothetical protein